MINVIVPTVEYFPVVMTGFCAWEFHSCFPTMLPPTVLLNPEGGGATFGALPQSFLLRDSAVGLVKLPAINRKADHNVERSRANVPNREELAALKALLETGELQPALEPFTTDYAQSFHLPALPPRSVHVLGENDRELLTAHAPDHDTARDLQRIHVSAIAASGGATALGEPAPVMQLALTQPQFRLADVFDPQNVNDHELFQSQGDDDDTGSDRSTASLHNSSDVHDSNFGYSKTLTQQRDSLSVDDLDVELDSLLGRFDAFWNASAGVKARWKLRDSASAPHQETDVWAVHDAVDVSDFISLVPDPALEYPFDLDQFQKRALFRLERNENVFVAAHTSAGKTVVAEYAIALALRHRTRVIYTSPIKTLSNQKFRDFTERFGDVGLITGDVSVNAEAQLLIMTTEILRSMLYRGVDLIRDLEWVIFDEVHWASNPERGVVWEESIILLPDTCGIVMLSATVPNALEFASWVGRTKKKPMYVISTLKRPVPLKHSLFVKNELFSLYDSSNGGFLHLNYKAASEKNSALSKSSNVKFGGGRQHAWVPLVKYLRKHDLDPAIIFFFSKRKCEEAADSLSSTDLTAGATEKNQIHSFFQKSISRLSVADQGVPQIARCRDILKRGIGVHHSGILPIVKEVTEVLFQMVRSLFFYFLSFFVLFSSYRLHCQSTNKCLLISWILM